MLSILQGMAQAALIRFECDEMTIESALAIVNKQTKINIINTSDKITQNRIRNIKISTTSLEYALATILDGYNYALVFYDAAEGEVVEIRYFGESADPIEAPMIKERMHAPGLAENGLPSGVTVEDLAKLSQAATDDWNRPNRIVLPALGSRTNVLTRADLDRIMGKAELDAQNREAAKTPAEKRNEIALPALGNNPGVTRGQLKKILTPESRP